MSKQYEIRTIKDIFDKVPADRWEVLVGELLPMLRQADAMRTLAEVVGVDPQTAVFSETVVWVDDGEATITTNVSAHEAPDIGFSVKSKIKEQ